MAQRRAPKAAMAVRYDAARDRAPRIVAKGRGAVAAKILEMAREYGIPIHEDPELIEALARLDVSEQIPPELYAAMAEVLTFIYRANKKKRDSLPKI